MPRMSPRLASLLAGVDRTYLVGGTVRDLLMARPCADHDIVTHHDPGQLAERMARQTGGRVIVFRKADYAVHRVVSPEEGVLDVSGLHGKSIEDDLAERDFTINAMAMVPLSERILDPLNGLDDLRKKCIRITSADVFERDPARLLRAFRLSAELDFRISEATQSALTRNAVRIDGVPGERLRQELMKLLDTPRAGRCLRDMAKTGVLPHLVPQWPRLAHLTIPPAGRKTADVLALETVGVLDGAGPSNEVESGRPADAIAPPIGLVKLAALLADIGRPAVRHRGPGGRWMDPASVPCTVSATSAVMTRLRMSRQEQRTVAVLLTSLHRPFALYAAECAGKPTDLAATRFFMAAGGLVPSVLHLALARWCCLADQAGDSADVETCLRQLLHAYRTGYLQRLKTPPLLNGNDLMAGFGLTPGPGVGRLLAMIRLHQLSGRLTTPEAALALAKLHAATGPSK